MRIAFLVFHSPGNRSDSVLPWQQFGFGTPFLITPVEFGQLSLSLTLAVNDKSPAVQEPMRCPFQTCIWQTSWGFALPAPPARPLHTLLKPFHLRFSQGLFALLLDIKQTYA